MATFPQLGIPGRNLIQYRSGYGAEVAADIPTILPIGATIDWSLIVPLAATTTLPDTGVVFAGWQFLRYGQVMTRVTGAGANVVTITGNPTGGTFTLTATNSVSAPNSAQTTAPIAYNASAAAVVTALTQLMNVGSQNVVVTGGNGNPYLITFAAILGGTTLTASGTGLTGGSSPSVTVAAGPGGNSRYFGPYDPTATDGRANLNRGDCFIVNRSVVFGGSLQLPLQDDLHFSDCIIGGKVWGAKVIATNGTASLANGPTWTALTGATLGLLPMYV